MSAETQPAILSGDPDRQQAIDRFLEVTQQNPGTMHMVLDPDLFGTAIAPKDPRIDAAHDAVHDLLERTKRGLYLAYDQTTENLLTADQKYLEAEKALVHATDPEARDRARQRLALYGLGRFVERYTHVPRQRRPLSEETA